MLYSAAGFLGSVLSGWLYDRHGPIRVLVLSLLLSAAVILLPALFQDWRLYIGVMVLFGVTCAMPFPALNALASQVWPEGGRRAFNFIYVANNLGVAFGTAIGGLLAGWSFRAVFFGISAAYLMFLAIVWLGFRSRLNPALTGHIGRALRERHVSRTRLPWGAVLPVLLGFVLCWVVYVQWQSTVSVYMQSLGYPLGSYSILWTLNGLLIFALQPAVAVVARRIPALSVQMMCGSVLFACAYALLLVSHRYAAFVLAMVLLTCGEVLAWPAVPAAIAKLTPAERQGLLQGLTGGGATLGRMIGPVIGGMLYDHGPMPKLLACCVAVCAVPFALFFTYGRLARDTMSRHLA
jgi:MFS family permease